MKKKYADHPNWDLVKEKSYENKYFKTEDFTGNISLLTAVKVKEKIVKFSLFRILSRNKQKCSCYGCNG